MRKLRRILRSAGIHPQSPVLVEVLKRTGDVDLAATAFSMRPQPTWLRKLQEET